MIQAEAHPVVIETPVAGHTTLAVLPAIGDGDPTVRPQPIDSAGPPPLLANLTLDARSSRAPPSC